MQLQVFDIDLLSPSQVEIKLKYREDFNSWSTVSSVTYNIFLFDFIKHDRIFIVVMFNWKWKLPYIMQQSLISMNFEINAVLKKTTNELNVLLNFSLYSSPWQRFNMFQFFSLLFFICQGIRKQNSFLHGWLVFFFT